MATQLTAEELRALRGALGALPYSGGLQGPQVDSIRDAADLMVWLEAFGSHLKRVARANQETETTLAQLQRDVAGMHRLFGIDGQATA